jgi:hypothetical protein
MARTCAVCHADISGMRADARTCRRARCRKSDYRSRTRSDQHVVRLMSDFGKSGMAPPSRSVRTAVQPRVGFSPDRGKRESAPLRDMELARLHAIIRQLQGELAEFRKRQAVARSNRRSAAKTKRSGCEHKCYIFACRACGQRHPAGGVTEEILRTVGRYERKVSVQEATITALRADSARLAAQLAELERISGCSAGHPGVGVLLPGDDDGLGELPAGDWGRAQLDDLLAGQECDRTAGWM